MGRAGTNQRQASVDLAEGRSGLLDRPDVKGALGSLSRSNRPLADHLGDLRPEADDDAHDDKAAPRDAERALAFARLRALADEFLSIDSSGTASGFEAWVRSQARAADDDSTDAVEVATFHSAKGLEWETVHVAGLEQGLVPIAHAREPAALAEERRLLARDMTAEAFILARRALAEALSALGLPANDTTTKTPASVMPDAISRLELFTAALGETKLGGNHRWAVAAAPASSDDAPALPLVAGGFVSVMCVAKRK